jgi:hypothetical protein
MIDLEKIIRCPSCKEVTMELEEDNQIKCKSCGSRYPGAKNSYYLIDDNSINDDQVKMMKWWNDLCMQW